MFKRSKLIRRAVMVVYAGHAENLDMYVNYALVLMHPFSYFFIPYR